MKVFAKFDEIPSMTLQDIKETKCYGHTFVRSFVRTDGQRGNSIPSHKHSLRGVLIHTLSLLLVNEYTLKLFLFLPSPVDQIRETLLTHCILGNFSCFFVVC